MKGHFSTENSKSPIARLLSATVNYGLGGTIPKIVSFLLIPLYTAFLAPSDYGLIDLLGAFGALLVILMRAGVPGAVSRFYFDHRESAALKDYVTTISVFLNAASLVVGLIALVVLQVFGGLVLPGVPLWPFAVLTVGSAILTANSDLQRRLIQAREQSRYSAVLSIATTSGNILLALLFVVALRQGALGMVMAGLLANLVFFIQARHYLAAELRGRFRIGMLRSSLRYGVGILPGHVVNNFAPLVTRSALASWDSLAAVGLFGIAARFTTPLVILVSALGAAYPPIYFSLRSEGTADADAKLAAMADLIWLGAVLIVVGVAVAGPALVRIGTPVNYDSAGALVPILAVGCLGQALQMALGNELYWATTPWKVPLVSTLGVATTLSLTFAFAPQYGAVGLAWAQSAGYLVSAVLASTLALSQHRLPLVLSEFVKPPLMATGVYLLFSMLEPTSDVATLFLGAGAMGLVFVGLWSVRHDVVRRLVDEGLQLRRLGLGGGRSK